MRLKLHVDIGRQIPWSLCHQQFAASRATRQRPLPIERRLYSPHRLYPHFQHLPHLPLEPNAISTIYHVDSNSACHPKSGRRSPKTAKNCAAEKTSLQNEHLSIVDYLVASFQAGQQQFFFYFSFFMPRLAPSNINNLRRSMQADSALTFFLFSMPKSPRYG